MARVFFKATEDALNNITEQFKLAYPLRTSMLYTRNAASQIAAESPTADDGYFKTVFVSDGNVHGTGYRGSFLNTSWELQEEQLAFLCGSNSSVWRIRIDLAPVLPVRIGSDLLTDVAEPNIIVCNIVGRHRYLLSIHIGKIYQKKRSHSIHLT